jgi:hypothetical protein
MNIYGGVIATLLHFAIHVFSSKNTFLFFFLFLQDYIFDLHQATRYAQAQNEVDSLYGAKFQELSKTYYNDKSAWPSPESIASLVNDPVTGKGVDELFLW